MNERESLYAYLATLGSIVVLALTAGFCCLWLDGTDAQLAKIVAALAFIGGAMTGLIGVIGTFRPKGPAANVERADTVNQNGSDA